MLLETIEQGMKALEDIDRGVGKRENLVAKAKMGWEALEKLERIKAKFDIVKPKETVMVCRVDGVAEFLLVLDKDPATYELKAKRIGSTNHSDNDDIRANLERTLVDLDFYEEFDNRDWDMDDLLDDSNPTIPGINKVNLFPYLPD